MLHQREKYSITPMDDILKDILAYGEGSTTSGDVRDVAHAIVPGRLSHAEVRADITEEYRTWRKQRYPGVEVSTVLTIKFYNVRLVSALEVTKRGSHSPTVLQYCSHLTC